MHVIVTLARNSRRWETSPSNLLRHCYYKSVATVTRLLFTCNFLLSNHEPASNGTGSFTRALMCLSTGFVDSNNLFFKCSLDNFFFFTKLLELGFVLSCKKKNNELFWYIDRRGRSDSSAGYSGRQFRFARAVVAYQSQVGCTYTIAKQIIYSSHIYTHSLIYFLWYIYSLAIIPAFVTPQSILWRLLDVWSVGRVVEPTAINVQCHSGSAPRSVHVLRKLCSFFFFPLISF